MHIRLVGWYGMFHSTIRQLGYDRIFDTTVHSSAHSLYSNMLKMSEYSNVPLISFSLKPRSYLVGYHRVSYQYTPSSSHDPVHDFSPLVRGFTWNDKTHSIISLLELTIQHVLCAKDSAQHDTLWKCTLAQAL